MYDLRSIGGEIFLSKNRKSAYWTLVQYGKGRDGVHDEDRSDLFLDFEVARPGGPKLGTASRFLIFRRYNFQSRHMGSNLVKLLEITSDNCCPHLPRCQRDQQIINRAQPVGQSRSVTVKSTE